MVNGRDGNNYLTCNYLPLRVRNEGIGIILFLWVSDCKRRNVKLKNIDLHIWHYSSNRMVMAKVKICSFIGNGFNIYI